MATQTKTEFPTSDLIAVDKALESMRDSGFDLATAVGEVVDNSYEADATVVRIHTTEQEVPTPGKKAKKTKTIESIAFADNGNAVFIALHLG